VVQWHLATVSMTVTKAIRDGCYLGSVYIQTRLKIDYLNTTHHAMITYEGVVVQFHSFFDLGNRWR